MNVAYVFLKYVIYNRQLKTLLLLATTGSANVAADRTELSVLSRHLCSVSFMGNPFKWQIKCETHQLLRKREDIGEGNAHTCGNIFFIQINIVLGSFRIVLNIG